MEKELLKIDEWSRLANYISVAQMYLNNNIFLENKIIPEHLKKQAVGHWGVSPSINFIYAHLLSYSNRHNKKNNIVIGEGHAGSALLANLFLIGKISEKYEKYEYSKDGLEKLISEFGTKDGFRTEINPFYPDTIYDGGELGYSLAVAHGASINKKDTFTVCIIGDGEAETGTISASWNLINQLQTENNGYVLPILNLNGLKMGSESTFSKFDENNLKMYFEAMGYKTYIVHESHKEMYETLENIDFNEKCLIILKTKKGWTAPNDYELTIEGNKSSHKNPLAKINDDIKKCNYIEKWLKSYNIKEINKEDITSLIPKNELYEEKEKAIELNIKIDNTSKYIEDINKFEIKNEKTSNIKGIEKYLQEVIKKDKDFIILSPDELESNFLGELLENEETKNNVIEILNENVCQALLQGHINNGKRGIMISYEAFMPIITSMVSQYQKYLYQISKSDCKKELNSITYILTSVCWENNYSHQNPEFLSSMLEKEHDFVNVYMPMDANSLLVTLDNCLKEKNTINVIDVSKRPQSQYKTIEQAKTTFENGIEIFSETRDSKNNTDVILVAIGDYLLSQMIKVKAKLEENDIRVRLVYITKINKLKNLTEEEIEKYFGKEETIFIGTHTYANMIKALLFDKLKNRNVLIEGYKDKSDVSANYETKMELNDVSSEKIYEKIVKYLKENK